MADNDTAVVNSNVSGSNAVTPASSAQAQTSSAANSGASQAGSKSSEASVTSSAAGINASSSASDTSTSSAATSRSAQSGSSSAATSSASSAASEAPSNDNGRVLTDQDYYNSQSYQNAGFSVPPFPYDLDDAYNFPHDPNYMWVAYQLKPGETLVTMWFRYRVRPAEVMKWSFIFNYDWQEKIVTMRVPRASIPHD